jgi:hypothetical protein
MYKKNKAKKAVDFKNKPIFTLEKIFIVWFVVVFNCRHFRVLTHKTHH